MDFVQLLQLSLVSQILSSSMGDHDDCVRYPYYLVSLVIAILIGAGTSYMFTIMYHADPAITAASASANDTEANSAPNTGGGGSASGATTDQVALVSGTGSGGHATSASGQNTDPVTVQVAAGSGQNSDHMAVQAAAGSGLNSEHSTGHVLGSGRSSDATLSFYSVRSSVATLGSGGSSDAAFSSGQHSDFITIHSAGGSGLSSEPSTGHVLGSGGTSDHTTDHAALVTDTDSGCHATSDSGPSFGPTTAIAASGSGPSSGPTTVHDDSDDEAH
ncbi:hypothetical protein RGQ29_015947 [Quercus rubra]|uniref:Uncharacterized protein n=1 Tax=Quercus rubra TaxID=3512 RepID=A0AAN7FWM1_QUERU|nr:hypothetical protein RGQ29_015947 [Quercus rubra]